MLKQVNIILQMAVVNSSIPFILVIIFMAGDRSVLCS